MTKINKYIHKKSIEILMKDEISGIKERFSFNINSVKSEVLENVKMICYENFIPLDTDDDDDIEFINQELEEFYEL